MIENDYSKIVELFHGQLMYNIYDENSLIQALVEYLKI